MPARETVLSAKPETAMNVHPHRHGAGVTFRRITNSGAPPARDYMSLRPCPACGGERFRPLLEHENFQFYIDAAVSKQQTIRQVQCLHCFAAFMNPTFNATGFAVLFAEAGASYGSTSSHQAEQIAWLQERGLLERGTTLLDVGCYEGSFLGRLPREVKGIGVDIDEPAIERARQRFAPSDSHRFICADFERVDVDEAIDVITMFHVLEHLPRPVEVLKRLRHLAGPRTRLLVEVPVVENVIFGDACGFLAVQHLTHFSIASLHNALHAAGWRVTAHCNMDGYNGFRILAERGPTQANWPEPKDVGLFLNYFSRWYAALSEIEKRLQRVTAQHCVLRGGGLQTEYLFQLTSLMAAERKFVIVDIDPHKQGKTWRGIDIVGPECLASLDWRDTQVVLSSYSHQDAMREEVRSAGIPETAVVSLYDQVWRY
jgi:SAM-dependent methyltransferase